MTILTMPRLGETMEDGVVSAWLVQPGQSFKRGDPLIEIETDKTAVEFPALGPGMLTETLVGPGDRVTVGDPIAQIDLGGAEDWTGGEGQEETPSEAATTTPAAATAPASAVTSGHEGALPRATPVARRAARRAGIDLSSLSGSGRRGRIELRDVMRRMPDAAAEGESSVDGISYAVSGSPTGTPVLLLHGYAGDRSTWATLASGLARRGMKVVTVDLRAMGGPRARQPRRTISGAGLGTVVREVFGGQAPHVVSHSLGSVPATRLAQAGQAASLTLIAPAGLGLAIDAEFIRGMADPASVGEVSHLLRRLSDRPNSLSAEVIGTIYEAQRQGRLAELSRALLGRGGQTVDLTLDLEALSRQMAVRVLTGHRDRILDWQDVLALSPRIAVHHFPSAGHMPHWDHPAEVLDIISRALAE
ncbi:Dihydrolipoamide acyltransferase component of branched-chain alpha-keto acid dehydrogenase complex [Rubellimicrobium mesophilum DSM 19309]|uniref:Dihydrolipoamide acyltransferase component of branched-chain alpha-keto acid dehydrogenase complex n=1 Tax=Rubellimicrobium mesophilum DSM 19309 TaxID=442562 RepID=A0A017HN39_9RHOB|nr:alpha/beta fold hydrolase [Rubellimicrobium mesophilum]EYD75533.1 Dihydrolipoamide acyltransferase component of branched-chain alpha-keto acid dehydrogenase complex [Rubellimicrobium mesophilum DSM 19309]